MLVETELNDVIASSEIINVYNNGEISVYKFQDKEYNQIINEWKILTEDAREMPAYGVSLHKETTAAMAEGLWVEFVFDKQYCHNEMPFEKLLVNVERQWQGFNIVRYNSMSGYDGRCYYFDLVGKDMSLFYDFLADL